MNEHGFIRSIHRKLPTSVYAWKINDNYAGGVADAYYSGKAGDCWIEYKYLTKLPIRDSSKVTFGTSTQQKLWLKARFDEGRDVALVVGSQNGCVVLTGEDMALDHISRADFISRAVDKQAVIDFIINVTTTHTVSSGH
ncbi:hypothetical protein DV711_06375 [Motiliproteus coralliicola]|uniref:Restriction endonuclease type IV Mrr domain-containing protein n=1 Tax=Motiliproteus coralliicola TaxID=2283196 RepID=A0A369WVW2_9GAMM|nr:hypothetical protein [Motiliproteus coralliicola]RDE25179.1 hypothetical protein DV711_06375 [Motiliproteus coralliicola]